MKEFKITKVNKVDVHEDFTRRDKIVLAFGDEDMQVSDGYHTMDELYEHRITLYLKLAGMISSLGKVEDSMKPLESMKIWPRVWRSKLHSDKSEFKGWFILGIGKEKGKQITYHLPLSKWEDTEFAETLDTAPEWDGHTASEVLTRIKNL